MFSLNIFPPRPFFLEFCFAVDDTGSNLFSKNPDSTYLGLLRLQFHPEITIFLTHLPPSSTNINLQRKDCKRGTPMKRWNKYGLRAKRRKTLVAL